MLVSRRDLPQRAIQEFGLREDLLRSRRVKVALILHKHTPRSLSLPLLRTAAPFDMLEVAKHSHVLPDLKRLAEELLINRIPGLALGERVAMARQGSARAAGILLLDREKKVYTIALEHARMTEELILKALTHAAISAGAIEAIATHPVWSVNRAVRLALLRHPLTSLARVLVLADQTQKNDLLEIVHDPRMPANRRTYLTKLAESRKGSALPSLLDSIRD